MTNHDLKESTNGQACQLYNTGFSKEPSAAISTIRDRALRTWWHSCTSTAFAAVTIAAPQSVCAFRRLTVNNTSTTTAVAAVAAGSLISPRCNRHRSCVAATAPPPPPPPYKFKPSIQNAPPPPPPPPAAPVMMARPSGVGHGHSSIPDSTIRLSLAPCIQSSTIVGLGLGRYGPTGASQFFPIPFVSYHADNRSYG